MHENMAVRKIERRKKANLWSVSVATLTAYNIVYTTLQYTMSQIVF